jgi:uncharacterized protein (DUF2267 family)
LAATLEIAGLKCQEGAPSAAMGPSALVRVGAQANTGRVDHELDVIDRTVAKTYEWLHKVAERASLDDPHRAYQVLRAVLHALRDRVEPNIAAHVAAQLPLLVRGIFYEGWDPAKTPLRMSLAELLARVEKEAGLKSPSEAEEAARAVIAVCWDELGEGTMDHLISVLPRDFAVLM